MQQSKCSLCKGTQMVMHTSVTMRKCPACKDLPSPKFDELFKVFTKTFIKNKTMKNTENKNKLTPKELDKLEESANKHIMDKLEIMYPEGVKIDKEKIERTHKETQEKLKEQLKKLNQKSDE